MNKEKSPLFLQDKMENDKNKTIEQKTKMFAL